MQIDVIYQTTEERRRLFKQVEAEVAQLRIAEEHKFGAVNALYIHKLNKQAGLDDLAALAAVYVAGTQHGMAVSRRTWVDASVTLPEPLQDVIVAHDFDGEITTDMAFVSLHGTWFLVGVDEHEIHPILWQPMPALPANLVNATTH